MNISKTEIFKKVKSLTAEHLGVNKENITKEVSFMNDLGADSFDAIELTLAFEDKFEIGISRKNEKRLGLWGMW